MAKSIIYTGSGDKGMTSLVGGERVSKSSQRIESYGTVDELNSFIGLLMTELKDQKDIDFLLAVQSRLFSVGAYLETDTKTVSLKEGCGVAEKCVRSLEMEIDRIDGELPKMKHFILPGGCRSASLSHVCRTICRRAEREIYRLAEQVEIEPLLLVYMNRLSDYFFVLARKECIREKVNEIIWDYTCK